MDDYFLVHVVEEWLKEMNLQMVLFSLSGITFASKWMVVLCLAPDKHMVENSLTVDRRCFYTYID